jgi:hypothetical protein
LNSDFLFDFENAQHCTPVLPPQRGLNPNSKIGSLRSSRTTRFDARSTEIPEKQNGAGRGVGASAAADAVPLQNAHRNHADFRIRVEPICNTPFDERSAHRIRQDGLNSMVVSADKQNECF